MREETNAPRKRFSFDVCCFYGRHFWFVSFIFILTIFLCLWFHIHNKYIHNNNRNGWNLFALSLLCPFPANSSSSTRSPFHKLSLIILFYLLPLSVCLCGCHRHIIIIVIRVLSLTLLSSWLLFCSSFLSLSTMPYQLPIHTNIDMEMKWTSFFSSSHLVITVCKAHIRSNY